MKQPTKEQLDEAYKLQTEYYELCKNQEMDRREWIEARHELWEKMLLKLAEIKGVNVEEIRSKMNIHL